jgi:type II secretory pathway predicted ATPase ExeA
MYLTHWGLRRRPFDGAPDARFFFHSATHDSALAELLYAADTSHGAALLVGPFGSGKTLLLRALLAGLPADRFTTAHLSNALMEPAEVLLACARKLGAADLPERAAEVSASLAQHRLESRLAALSAAGQRAVLAIDDAHAVADPAVWEALRLVLGLWAGENRALTVLMAGASELLDRVESAPGFAERVVVRTSLVPLTEEESLDYILHRLACAGASSGIFTRGAAREIARRSGGIPGTINRLADLSMAAACGMGMKAIGPAVISMVASDQGIGKPGGA